LIFSGYLAGHQKEKPWTEWTAKDAAFIHDGVLED
jgi:hypothetical protein